jgi:hypothetical protein
MKKFPDSFGTSTVFAWFAGGTGARPLPAPFRSQTRSSARRYKHEQNLCHVERTYCAALRGRGVFETEVDCFSIHLPPALAESKIHHNVLHLMSIN